MSRKRKIALVFVSVVLAAALIYTRPMTLSQICGDIDVSQSVHIHGYYVDSPRMVEDGRFEINEGDKRLAEMTELFKNQKFKRSLWNFLPRGTKTHRWEEGDFKWEVMFNLEDVTLPDGSKASGTIIHVSNFFGLVEIHFDGDVWRCDVTDKDDWLEQVMMFIKEPLSTEN